MMSVPPFGIYFVNPPNDRSSAQLRAYLRDEYRADVAWLNDAVRSQSPSLPSRLRGWLAARRSRRRDGSTTESPEAVPRAISSASAGDAEGCLHPLTEDLGLGGGAGFLRCAVCGDIIVVRGARQWRIRSTGEVPPPGPGEAPGAEPSPAGPGILY